VEARRLAGAIHALHDGRGQRGPNRPVANPAKVQNFLDVAGTFDPSLICVMLGAVVVTFLGLSLSL
jgi:hypothetical protein